MYRQQILRLITQIGILGGNLTHNPEVVGSLDQQVRQRYFQPDVYSCPRFLSGFSICSKLVENHASVM